jgi:hypothetical protein
VGGRGPVDDWPSAGSVLASICVTDPEVMRMISEVRDVVRRTGHLVDRMDRLVNRLDMDTLESAVRELATEQRAMVHEVNLLAERRLRPA